MDRLETIENVLAKMLDEKYNVKEGVRSYWSGETEIDMSKEFDEAWAEMSEDDGPITEKVHLNGQLIYDENHWEEVGGKSAITYIKYDRIWFNPETGETDYIGIEMH